MSEQSRRCKRVSQKRKALTLEERVQVVKLSIAGETAIRIAQLFEVGRTQIQSIIQDQKNILQRWEDGVSANRKTKPFKCKYDLINNRLFDWFCEVRSQNIPVSGRDLRDKATHIAAELCNNDFSASNGWLTSWLKRNNIHSRVIESCDEHHHDNADFSIEEEVTENWIKSLPKECEGYKPCDMYCADETNQSFKALPSSSSMSEQSRHCKRVSQKRKALTLEERVQVVKLSRTGETAISIARLFEVGKTQIQSIIQDQKNILQRWEDGVSANRKTKPFKCKYDLINNRLFDWFCEVRSQNIPVSGRDLRDKATHIAAEIGNNDFSASNGWLSRWLKRNNIHSRTIESCDENDVDFSIDEEVIENWIKSLPKKCEGYKPCDIYCADETNLFFKALPSTSMLTIEESTCDFRTAKDRITLLIATNATGEKLEPVVIGNNASPSCFFGKDIHELGVHYFYNEESWMTADIFTKWLETINKSMLLVERKILLFVNQCHVHTPVESSNVKLVMVPPNAKTKCQPCSAGIIQAIKVNYRRRLLNHILLQMDKNDKALKPELAQNINLLDAVQWLKSAVDLLKPQTISNCFDKCGFPIIPHSSEIPESSKTESNNSLNSYDGLLPNEVTFKDFASFDDYIPTFSSSTTASTNGHRDPNEEEEKKSSGDKDKTEPVIDYKTAASYARELVKFAVSTQKMHLANSLSMIQADIEESYWDLYSIKTDRPSDQDNQIPLPSSNG